MSGVTFVPTTLAKFKAIVNDQNINLPLMLEEEWIPADIQFTEKPSLVPAEIFSSLNFNNLSSEFKDEGDKTKFEH